MQRARLQINLTLAYTACSNCRLLSIHFALFLAIILAPQKLLAEADAWQQLSNNNHIIKLQQQSGDPRIVGDVKIDFYGHAAFKITSPNGMVILFDPWRNDPSGAWGLWFPKAFPKVHVDVVLSTHAHFDHDAVYRAESPMVLDRMAGNWQLGDVRIHGLADKHVCVSPGVHQWHKAFDEFGIEGCPPNNPGHMDNVIYVIETGGMRIGMWGDNRQQPAAHVSAQLNNLDVLILPVDSSEHLLSYAETNAIIDKFNPRIVIPAHYLTVGASSVLSTLGTADQWVAQQENKTILDSASLVLNATDVKRYERRVMYFGKEHLKE